MLLSLLAPGVGMGAGGVTATPHTQAVYWSAASPVLGWSAAALQLSWSSATLELGWGYDVAVKETFVLYKRTDSTLHFLRKTGTTDITGWTFRLLVYSLAGGYDSPAVMDSASTPSITFTVVDGPGGSVDVFIPNAVLGNLGRGYYLFEFCRADSGALTELSYGSLTVGPLP